jgi:phosphohistidine phosphatase
LSDKIGDMPTCAVAEFEFDSKSWTAVGRQAPDKATLHEPR